jgi:hypothetical protein
MDIVKVFDFQVKPVISCDFSESALNEAAQYFGVMPEQMTVFLSAGYAPQAQLVRDKYRCKIVLVPPELLCDRCAWAIEYGGKWVWSPGA